MFEVSWDKHREEDSHSKTQAYCVHREQGRRPNAIEPTVWQIKSGQKNKVFIPGPAICADCAKDEDFPVARVHWWQDFENRCSLLRSMTPTPTWFAEVVANRLERGTFAHIKRLLGEQVLLSTKDEVEVTKVFMSFFENGWSAQIKSVAHRTKVARYICEAGEGIQQGETYSVWRERVLGSAERVEFEEHERGDVSSDNQHNPVELRVLGLRWPCTPDDVQKAYRKKAAEAHPDRGGTHAKMVELNAIRERALRWIESR